MKNIFKVDISTYIIIIISFLAGNFKYICLLYFIIIFHELGHYIFIKIFKKEILSIKIYPFGGITIYNSLVNHKIKEELLIASSGIIHQLYLYILFFILFKINIINHYTYELFLSNNTSLLLFNIIPIIGLDGEKIIHLLLEYFLPYSKANIIVIIISFITILLLIINSCILKINSIFVLSFLIYKIIYFIKNKKYLENKFILERYLYNIPFKRIKYINNNNLNNMYQETYHFFNHRKEYDYLKERYNALK